MTRFFGMIRYEFLMSIKRKGILVIALVTTAFYIYLWMEMGGHFETGDDLKHILMSEAGQTVFFLNLFYPVIAGIAASDRVYRDFKLGVRELIRVTGLSNPGYVIGKYFGIALSLIAVETLIVIFVCTMIVVMNKVPAVFILYNLLAVLLVSVPGLLFITAFSIACPLIMPLRVYQILYTGYWYWGNFLSPTIMFTISDTLLNASGKLPLMGFFGVKISLDSPEVSFTKAITNIAVLLSITALALAVMTAVVSKKDESV